MDSEQACGLADAAVDLLRRVDVGVLDANGVRSVTDRLCAARTRVAHLDTALAARATELVPTGTCEDAVDLLSGVGAMPAGRARRVARNAELLGRMPELAAAFGAAAVSEDHVDAVATARRRIDRSVWQAFDSLDAELVASATAHTPDQLAEHLRFVQRRLERELSRDLDLRRRRGVRASKWSDKAGVYQLHGSFDPEMGARIFGAIDTAVDTLRAGKPGSLVPGDHPNDALASDREFLAAPTSTTSSRCACGTTTSSTTPGGRSCCGHRTGCSHCFDQTAPSTARHDHPDSGGLSSDLPTLTVPPHRADDEPTRAQPRRDAKFLLTWGCGVGSGGPRR